MNELEQMLEDLLNRCVEMTISATSSRPDVIKWRAKRVEFEDHKEKFLDELRRRLDDSR